MHCGAVWTAAKGWHQWGDLEPALPKCEHQWTFADGVPAVCTLCGWYRARINLDWRGSESPTCVDCGESVTLARQRYCLMRNRRTDCSDCELSRP